MEKNYQSIVWSPQSERDLDDILEYYLKTSPETAYQRILEILSSTENLVFSEQWQIDEYDPSCRRIIAVKKFRVLYRIVNNTILITRVYPTKKDPKGIK